MRTTAYRSPIEHWVQATVDKLKAQRELQQYIWAETFAEHHRKSGHVELARRYTVDPPPHRITSLGEGLICTADLALHRAIDVSQEMLRG